MTASGNPGIAHFGVVALDCPDPLHIDFDVPDLDAGEEQVLAIGARKHDVQPAPQDFRVYLDPAGHPFCLVRG